MRTLHPLMAAATALAATLPAQAQISLGDSLTFRGFGTLGVVQADTDDGEYRREQQARGATRSASALVDSNLGLQLDWRVTPWLSGTVQTLTVQRTSPKLSTRVEWAFVNLSPADGISVRAGRLNLPTFMVSDSRRVGYANTALRPANEVYGLDLLNGGLEGFDASWRIPVAGHGLTLTAVGGRTSYNDLFVAPTRMNGVRGLNAVWDGDWYQVRLGRVEAKPDLSGLAMFLQPLLPPGKSLSDEKYSFSGIGISAERANVMMQAEYVQRRSTVFNARVGGDGWYVLGGYRMGKWLPYAQLSRQKASDERSGFTFPQETLAAGLRWDLAPKMALKLQVERIKTDGTPGASFLTPFADTPFGPVPLPVKKPVTTISAALDFVF